MRMPVSYQPHTIAPSVMMPIVDLVKESVMTVLEINAGVSSPFCRRQCFDYIDPIKGNVTKKRTTGFDIPRPTESFWRCG